MFSGSCFVSLCSHIVLLCSHFHLGPLVGQFNNPSMAVSVVERVVKKMLFFCHYISSLLFLTCDLHFCPPPELKTNNLLLMLTPCHFWFISTFPLRGSLCSLELQFSQPHLSSPPISSQSDVHSEVFVLIAFPPLCCWLVSYRDAEGERDGVGEPQLVNGLRWG